VEEITSSRRDLNHATLTLSLLQHALVLRTSERDYVLCSNDVLGLEEWYEALQQIISE
jgi:hypothetical protein